MKPAVLVPLFVSATLFLAGPARGGDETHAPAEATPAGDLAPGGATYQQLLQRYDTNHDGKLDDNELAAAHEEMGRERLENGRNVGKKVRQQLLEMFDQGHKGYLTADEREAARQYLQQHIDLRDQFIRERNGQTADNSPAARLKDMPKQGGAAPTAKPASAAGNDPLLAP
ncbi:MAG TPA: EF-hand domain-containing protein [Opitutaceae bacterium]|nr:EF-hand domain-containing protein [Opitutaceae bacterium]